LSLKCSDVRVARGLISSYSGRFIGAAEAAFWRSYDECWELIEDLEDLAEDGGDWNFNFWLYSFMSGGSADRGVAVVSDLLRRGLVDLQSISSRVCATPPLAAQAVNHTLRAGDMVLRNRGRVFAAIAAGSVTPYPDRLSFPKHYMPSPTLDEHIQAR
jgi:hypothetical protein